MSLASVPSDSVVVNTTTISSSSSSTTISSSSSSDSGCVNANGSRVLCSAVATAGAAACGAEADGDDRSAATGGSATDTTEWCQLTLHLSEEDEDAQDGSETAPRARVDRDEAEQQRRREHRSESSGGAGPQELDTCRVDEQQQRDEIMDAAVTGGTCAGTAALPSGDYASRLAAEDTKSVSALDTESVSAVDTKCVSAVDTEGVSAVDTESVSAVDTEGVRAVDTEGVRAVDTEGVSAEDTEGVSAVDTESVSAEDTECVSAEDTECVSAVDTEGVSAEDTEGVSAEDTECVSAVDTEGVSAVDTEGVSAEDTEGVSAVDTERVSAVDTECVSAMDTEGVSAMDTGTTGAVAPDALLDSDVTCASAADTTELCRTGGASCGNSDAPAIGEQRCDRDVAISGDVTAAACDTAAGAGCEGEVRGEGPCGAVKRKHTALDTSGDTGVLAAKVMRLDDADTPAGHIAPAAPPAASFHSARAHHSNGPLTEAGSTGRAVSTGLPTSGGGSSGGGDSGTAGQCDSGVNSGSVGNSDRGGSSDRGGGSGISSMVASDGCTVAADTCATVTANANVTSNCVAARDSTAGATEAPQLLNGAGVARLPRRQLEALVLEQMCGAISSSGAMAQLRRSVRQLATAAERYQRKYTQLQKQYGDLQLIVKRLAHEQTVRSTVCYPVKVTRTVGLQVSVPARAPNTEPSAATAAASAAAVGLSRGGSSTSRARGGSNGGGGNSLLKPNHMSTSSQQKQQQQQKPLRQRVRSEASVTGGSNSSSSGNSSSSSGGSGRYLAAPLVNGHTAKRGARRSLPTRSTAAPSPHSRLASSGDATAGASDVVDLTDDVTAAAGGAVAPPRRDCDPAPRAAAAAASVRLPPMPQLHPAAFPPTPPNPLVNTGQLLPPPPLLKVAHRNNGIVLSWTMQLTEQHAPIISYHLFAYQQSQQPVRANPWKKVGDVRALPLPMACTLTQFQQGKRYHFAVRAEDGFRRRGPFSNPSSISLSSAPTPSPAGSTVVSSHSASVTARPPLASSSPNAAPITGLSR